MVFIQHEDAYKSYQNNDLHYKNYITLLSSIHNGIAHNDKLWPLYWTDNLCTPSAIQSTHDPSLNLSMKSMCVHFHNYIKSAYYRLMTMPIGHMDHSMFMSAVGLKRWHVSIYNIITGQERSDYLYEIYMIKKTRIFRLILECLQSKKTHTCILLRWKEIIYSILYKTFAIFVTQKIMMYIQR